MCKLPKMKKRKTKYIKALTNEFLGECIRWQTDSNQHVDGLIRELWQKLWEYMLVQYMCIMKIFIKSISFSVLYVSRSPFWVLCLEHPQQNVIMNYKLKLKQQQQQHLYSIKGFDSAYIDFLKRMNNTRCNLCQTNIDNIS